MIKSMRIKLITIYFLLVFIAMSIVSVFIIQQFEQYHLESVSGNLIQIAGSIITTLQDTNWQHNKKDTQENIVFYEKMDIEIYVIDKDNNFTIISSTNIPYLNQNAMHILEPELILAAFNGDEREKDIISRSGETTSSKNIVFPLFDENNMIAGAVYLRKNLESIYKTLDQSKYILTRATLLALFITILLGYLIAKSITGPINDVTIKAEKMAKGDFDQIVEVKSNDEIGQLASMFNFLTARLKSSIQEVSSEKNKLDTIINYMADGLVAATETGEIIHTNPRALEILKLDEEAVHRKSFDEIFRELNPRLTLDYFKKESWSGSQIIDMGDGIKVRANYAPFTNETNTLAGIILLLQDVTEHEKLENMRKEFVANVSHELKTPLTTIKSYTETILDGTIEDKQLTQQFLNVIDSEVDRMTRLVRDLLQLSNLDFQQYKWNKKQVYIDDIIEKVLIKLELSAHNKQQILKYVKDCENIKINGDEDKIEQVISNIITNAIKYTNEEGQITIELLKEGDYAVISVEDNGIGIPAKDLSRVFERFYRVDKARSRELGGTGLGLSIAKQIIDSHEGTIKIVSGEGSGTKVTITLPVIEEMAESFVV
ncbi:sensor histidine kinase [Serpentinicella alkaliphila]|uniref:histidine kinase n=1 Tax=Serpentinicella alkaliphila TaxID=1734049 RepID=A0A4R2TIZ5_9FIRM|nr:ATP-binding protein [Serpentinicella alkaliphila]QUH25180.1 HAMP domain-containing protein [Serpentinicella alkaliphila]TCQ02272.1 two-component system sensor histidine kinase VicK [Serpentinicella alkaliphila]